MGRFHLLRDVIKNRCYGTQGQSNIGHLVPEDSGELKNIGCQFNDHKENRTAGGNGQRIGKNTGMIQVALGAKHGLNPRQHPVGCKFTQEHIGDAAADEGAADEGEYQQNFK